MKLIDSATCPKRSHKIARRLQNQYSQPNVSVAECKDNMNTLQNSAKAEPNVPGG